MLQMWLISKRRDGSDMVNFLHIICFKNQGKNFHKNYLSLVWEDISNAVFGF